METYKIQEGVVLVEIQSVPLLVADASAMRYCPYVLQTNELGAFIWRLLEQGFDFSDIVSAVIKEYEVEEPNIAEADIQSFIQKLITSHYLILERKEVHEK